MHRQDLRNSNGATIWLYIEKLACRQAESSQLRGRPTSIGDTLARAHYWKIVGKQYRWQPETVTRMLSTRRKKTKEQCIYIWRYELKKKWEEICWREKSSGWVAWWREDRWAVIGGGVGKRVTRVCWKGFWWINICRRGRLAGYSRRTDFQWTTVLTHTVSQDHSREK